MKTLSEYKTTQLTDMQVLAGLVPGRPLSSLAFAKYIAETPDDMDLLKQYKMMILNEMYDKYRIVLKTMLEE